MAGLIHLRTLVLSADGHGMAPVGTFLHAPDRPAWTQTLTYDGEAATILGATIEDDEWGQPNDPICLVVDGREKAPLIADADTRVVSLDAGGWVPVSRLAVGESLRIPDTSPIGGGLVPTWSRVRKVMKSSRPEAVFLGTHRVWGRLVLKKGTWSWACPSAFVHV